MHLHMSIDILIFCLDEILFAYCLKTNWKVGKLVVLRASVIVLYAYREESSFRLLVYQP